MKDQFNEESEAQKLRDDDFIGKCLEEFDEKFNWGVASITNSTAQSSETPSISIRPMSDIKSFLRQKLLEAYKEGIKDESKGTKNSSKRYLMGYKDGANDALEYIAECWNEQTTDEFDKHFITICKEARALNK